MVYLLINNQVLEKSTPLKHLFQVTNNRILNMDGGNLNGVVFLDLKKAFDCVDHDILIRKLYYYGIRGRELNFHSYLSNRNHCCKVDQAMSNERILIKMWYTTRLKFGPLAVSIIYKRSPRLSIIIQGKHVCG